jgi:asparagine synthase (glutamine-hydrolysing)
MTERVAHRGPDDSGVGMWPDEPVPVSLGHRRLSIIDLSAAGHQPMANEDGSVWTVFNGEIYNFPALRTELVAAGHVFRSETDTEVLVHGYEEWGLDLVGRLNGIFAFALWDRRRSQLHLVRDRYGVKPLYYARAGEQVLFASEIKSLLCSPEVSRELRPEALLAYLQFRYCPEPLSLFQHVAQVPPGHILTLGSGEPVSRAYYALRFPDRFADGSVKTLAGELRERLTAAVERQMISDVPVGLFLSGGVDSGGLLAMARSHKRDALKTFTIAFRREDQEATGEPGDVEYARELATQFGTDHQEIVLEPRIVDVLPNVIWHLDNPIADPAAITSYLICQMARERDTKVLLSGQGGDEVFCGYPWHLGAHLAAQYRRAPKLMRAGIERALQTLPASRHGPWTGTFRRLRKFGASASMSFDDSLIGFLSYASSDNLRNLLGVSYAESVAARVGERSHRELLNESRGWNEINRMLHLDMGTFLPALNLAYTDKTSMAFGVEVRVPYIDNEIVDFMATIPPALKLHGLTRKYLLKEALRGLVPDRVLSRRKAGFGVPIRRWIVSDLKEMIGDLLSPDTLRRRGYFDPAYVWRLIDENASGRHDYNYLIYTLLTFELWCRIYLDGGNS